MGRRLSGDLDPRSSSNLKVFKPSANRTLSGRMAATDGGPVAWATRLKHYSNPSWLNPNQGSSVQKPISKKSVSILAVGSLFLTACSQPIGVKPVEPVDSYVMATRTPLSGSEPSQDAKAVLHRYNLLEAYDNDPKAVLAQLHGMALKDDRRDHLFALAELNYHYAMSLPLEKGPPVFGQRAQEAYLQAAVYAYLFLLGPGKEAPPSAFDNRFREACEIYNRSLDLAFRAGADEALSFGPEQRSLIFGKARVEINDEGMSFKPQSFEAFYPSDAYEVFGLTSRNRTPGLGVPVIGVARKSVNAPEGSALPITAFLRVEGDLASLGTPRGKMQLELFSSSDEREVVVNGVRVPLQTDNTAPLAYRLNDKELWSAGLKRFIFGEDVEQHVLLIQPYQKGRIPVVFVHGTGSSPVWWTEMVNTLRNDPVIRKHFQFWFYEYTSNLPVPKSAADLRDSLNDMVHQLDPQKIDPALQQMVVIGHSQGGMLTHMTAIDPKDQLWRAISDKPIDEIHGDSAMIDGFRHALFFEPLPFVKRLVFISTPHRGSFLTKGWVRTLARSALSLPVSLIQSGNEKFQELASQLKLGPDLASRMPTAVDGMSEDSPIMKVVAGMPLAQGVKAHSIIAVLPGTDIKTGNDGVVEYSSAHLDGVESEYVVRTGHSAQGHPLTIEEVRRILLSHCDQQPAICRND